MAGEDTRICHQCFGDAFLKRAIRRDGKRRKCSYCGKTLVTLSLEDVADLFETAIETNFERTPSEPSEMEQALLDHDLMDCWYEDGQPVLDLVQEIGETSQEVAEDIRSTLEDRHSTREDYEMGLATEFDLESHYEERATPSGELGKEWPRFEHMLKTKSRYMSVVALKTLDKIFEGLEGHRTHPNKSVILATGPGTEISTLYRARVFQSDAALFEALKRPELSIGPPPPNLAAAGRMNASGIPVFYGATDREVALAEVRPPVGSKVVVAQFEITRALRLLDVEALQSLSVGGSPFDPEYLLLKQKASFLSGLSEVITKPVMPDDETLNYIPTQVIAEYLASLQTPLLDGMVYPSVQAGNRTRNIVLFNKAAVVAKVARPQDISFDVKNSENFESGPEIKYTIREESDSEYVPPESEVPTLEHDIAQIYAFPDERKPALRISMENVWVYHVKQVAITHEDYKVDRRVWDKKHDRKFAQSQKALAATLARKKVVEL